MELYVTANVKPQKYNTAQYRSNFWQGYQAFFSAVEQFLQICMKQNLYLYLPISSLGVCRLEEGICVYYSLGGTCTVATFSMAL